MARERQETGKVCPYSGESRRAPCIVPSRIQLTRIMKCESEVGMELGCERAMHCWKSLNSLGVGRLLQRQNRKAVDKPSTKRA